MGSTYARVIYEQKIKKKLSIGLLTLLNLISQQYRSIQQLIEYIVFIR